MASPINNLQNGWNKAIDLVDRAVDKTFNVLILPLGKGGGITPRSAVEKASLLAVSAGVFILTGGVAHVMTALAKGAFWVSHKVSHGKDLSPHVNATASKVGTAASVANVAPQRTVLPPDREQFLDEARTMPLHTLSRSHLIGDMAPEDRLEMAKILSVNYFGAVVDYIDDFKLDEDQKLSLVREQLVNQPTDIALNIGKLGLSEENANKIALELVQTRPALVLQNLSNFNLSFTHRSELYEQVGSTEKGHDALFANFRSLVKAYPNDKFVIYDELSSNPKIESELPILKPYFTGTRELVRAAKAIEEFRDPETLKRNIHIFGITEEQYNTPFDQL